MEEKKNIPVQTNISDEELEGVAGGAVYDPVFGEMITTPFNSCSEWKCPSCGTYSGANCSDHQAEGKRWCRNCKYAYSTMLTMYCKFWKK